MPSVQGKWKCGMGKVIIIESREINTNWENRRQRKAHSTANSLEDKRKHTKKPRKHR